MLLKQVMAQKKFKKKIELQLQELLRKNAVDEAICVCLCDLPIS
jgi:hypothetical protein